MTVFHEIDIKFKLLTQLNSMILVSFPSAENALFNDVKKYDTFSSQSTENQPFRFWGTPGITVALYGHPFCRSH